MSKGLRRSISRGSKLSQSIIKQTFRFKDAAIEVDGASGVGFGSLILGDLPEGNIMFLGAAINMAFLEADAGIVDTFSGDFSVGTTPADDGTLSLGDVDIIPSTAIGAAVAGAILTVRATHTAAVTGTVYDNTAGALELNFNMLIDDASISADDTIVTLNGELYIAYIMLGDD